MSSDGDFDVNVSNTNGTRRKLETPPQRISLRSDDKTIPSKHAITNLILRELSDAKEEKTLVYDTDVDTVQGVIKELDRTRENRSLRLSYDSQHQVLKLVAMPSPIHDCHQPWLHSAIRAWTLGGLLLPQEADDLEVLTGTRFESFRAPYTSSRKEPDQCIMPATMTVPTVVVESGWSESRPQLHRDRDLWLLGGSGSVQLVMILKWSKVAQRSVKGDLEVFNLDAAGNVVTLQQEVIFPCPPPAIASSQLVCITRSQLFGPALPAGSNPATVLTLSLDNLRVIADRYIRREGFVPAQ
ncbi:hypothetical protein DTO271D3_8939 [Paecilomyces variotii]|nr:hypothetical protein DTO271D3_8939 [Paecilomyces variotii]